MIVAHDQPDAVQASLRQVREERSPVRLRLAGGTDKPMPSRRSDRMFNVFGLKPLA